MNEGRSAVDQAASGQVVALPECVEIETGPEPGHAVVWLHGLGADGHDFEPIVPMLGTDRIGPVRFVFPHAPRRPVTVNGGMVMRAWYDIRALDIARDQDRAGIEASADITTALIEREIERGIPPDRIVLAGFSQGGAMAAYVGLRSPHKLAGLLILSAYLLDEEGIPGDPVNRETAAFVGHGRLDPVVPVMLGRYLSGALKGLGMPVEYHEYDMPHSVAPEEIADISEWLARVLTVNGER
ncbi:MAG: carboxylesterase [Xanthomonadales bacterium]|nr:carboxylesterase [Xanthomonadales bacterium]